ncbi:putative fructokinase [Tritrichomonas foetus]|uniref:fructokinase n=1 Tax=Tritrichomonas foetus TaxID=1144522 RepID=A0A1J4JWC6_9EUKA|nr:putative fructokinase [Tritrichomonas foetus]|eukprot:OHT01830.1 putative fructokinase [Tritrichomonas foetus]
MLGKKNVCCIELGGTTSAVAIANEIGSFLWKKKGIPTAFPIRGEDAVKEICNEIKESGYDFEAIGIASFGPLNIEKGCIANTPKPNWKHFPLVEQIRKNLGTKVPIILETDVNAPAYSEFLALHERDSSVRAVAYLTVGTGVGAGVFVDGRPIHGIMHPEFGHIVLQAYPGDDFPGICPFHSNCIEGRITANSLAQRLGIKPEELKDVPNDHKVWDMFSYYIAAAATTAAYTYSIDRFVVGGGIMTGDNRGFLYEKANQYCKDMINGYLEVPKIQRPVYNKDAGLVGAAACALHPEVFIK